MEDYCASQRNYATVYGALAYYILVYYDRLRPVVNDYWLCTRDKLQGIILKGRVAQAASVPATSSAVSTR